MSAFGLPLDTFTPKAQQALNMAISSAMKLGHEHLGSEHLLGALVSQTRARTPEMFVGAKMREEDIYDAIHKASPSKVNDYGGKNPMLPPTPELKKVITKSAESANALENSFVSSTHMFLGIFNSPSSKAGKILSSLGVNLKESADNIMQGNQYDDAEDSNIEMHHVSEPGWSGDSVLDKYGKDLTRLAREDKLDPVIGRKSEIKRLAQVLCRRQKNNPVLIGEAGVGKTAIVEGLAQRLASGKVPKIMRDKIIYAIDLALIVAGSKYRGEFEERMKALVKEVTERGNIIVFIDELHTAVGAGNPEGGMDAANILKPALARGEFQCIGATTIAEYHKSIERDAALERRFQEIMVNDPTVEQAKEILHGIKSRYEAHHDVSYTDDAIRLSVEVSDRYMSGRHLPDKAIDIMDEAGARIRTEDFDEESPFVSLEREIKELEEKKVQCVSNEDYEGAASVKEEADKKREELKNNIEELESKMEPVKIDRDLILSVASQITGIPIGRMEDEAKRLIHMEKEIGGAVIGQKEAINIISKAIRRARTDLKDPARPIGSFVFLGFTGVGKTLLAKSLAEFMFGNSEALIKMDMSEYMAAHNVSRLVGSPPGYVGYGEGGQLTEKVRKRPYSVILFDEIEKAHPDVMNILLQLLEDGQMTDGSGVRVDFSNTIIIMTSNVGASSIKAGNRSLGFSSAFSDAKSEVEEMFLEAAKKRFRPEFLNRLDKVIVFNELGKKDLNRIVDIEMKKVTSRLTERKIEIRYDQPLRQFILEKGYQPEFGARPIRRAIDEHVNDSIADNLLNGEIEDGSVIKLVVKNNRVAFELIEVKEAEVTVDDTE